MNRRGELIDEWIKQQPGFVGGYHVQDSKTGRMLFCAS